MRAWLFRIMTNTWISAYRTRQCRPNECLTEHISDARLAADAAHSSERLRSAELQALERVADDDIRRALQALPEPQRLVIFYADVEGFRYKEIAALLNMPLGSVMSRVHRGRRHLRILLADVAVARGYRRDTQTPSAVA